MAHLGDGIRAMGILCEQWDVGVRGRGKRQGRSGQLTASASGSAEVGGGSCWLEAEWEIQIVRCPASPCPTRFMFTVADRTSPLRAIPIGRM